MLSSASCGGCVRADRIRTPKGHTRMPARARDGDQARAWQWRTFTFDAADIAWSLVTGTTPRGNYPGAPQTSATDDVLRPDLGFPTPPCSE